ncbi:MAG: substrate-binding domain-containing protein [Lachnospiraceae bacterium]|nr:substrate-binding domain-containing protein [Lachnospiraceae bacterium]
MKRYKKAACFCLLLLLLLAAGIGAYQAKRHQETRPLDIILIQKAIDETNDFWSSIHKGAKMAAREYGVNLTVWGPESEREVDKAHELIEDAIAQKPDAIALAPISYEETLIYARMIEEAGIPLILVDSVMAEPVGRCVVATDNVEGGYKMGAYMSQFVDENTAIGIVGHVQGSSTAREREQGFREGLGEDQEKIVQVVFCESSFELAREVTRQMLEEHPEINMIAGLNEYSSVGAAQAVRELGLEDRIHMVGFDSSKQEIQLLEEGIFDAIVIQQAFNMGYLGIEKAVKAARGEELPEYEDAGTVLITRENIYTEENQKLLFPF